MINFADYLTLKITVEILIDIYESRFTAIHNPRGHLFYMSLVQPIKDVQTQIAK